MQLEDELSADAKVGSTSADCPEKVWILRSASSQDRSIGNDNSYLEEICSPSTMNSDMDADLDKVIYDETVLRRKVAVTSSKEKPVNHD